MRSQATKPLPKKGVSNKTPIKTGSAAKQTKKKSVSPKKIKNLVSKSLIKSPKRTNISGSKDDVSSKKTDSDSSIEDRNESTSESSRASKSSSQRDESPSKKTKKEPKRRKIASKTTPSTSAKKVNTKKPCKLLKKGKFASKSSLNDDKDDSEDSDSDDVKYKINLDLIKSKTPKFPKAKTSVKKGSAMGSKKKDTQKHDVEEKEQKTDSHQEECVAEKNPTQNIQERMNEKDIKTSNEKDESNNLSDCTSPTKLSNVSSPTQPETPKQENERPPKFFTSSRSPRTVDIDVKCCKTSKGNLSVSERFLSMKCESKTDDISKDKSSTSTLVSQGPEIDVYTFTEKVDSPKSILSDFRSPVNKNIGRVRPIARVKGTIIDKKTEVEKKKYSPHRPIEEVVKLLKASKRSEVTNNSDEQSNATSDLDLSLISSEKDADEKPKPIVSKSYKMVARKSSITGKPFSPIKFLDQEPSTGKQDNKSANTKKTSIKTKRQKKKGGLSNEDIETSKFAFNTKEFNYTSSEESLSESNDENDTKESSESDSGKTKRTKNKKYKRITDSSKKKTSKELKELSKDSLVDLKDDDVLLGSEKPSKRRLKLLSMWTGPKKHRMASLNAIAKVHCLYENESRTHMELGLMKTVERQILPGTSKQAAVRKKEVKQKEVEKPESSTSESEYEGKKDTKVDDSSESSDDNPPQRSLRGEPGIRSAGKYWDPKSCTSSSEDSEMEYKKKTPEKKKITKTSTLKSDSDKPPAKMKKTAGVPLKKKRNRTEVVMDLKDMVVQKRMASLNATAILAASYEKRSSKSSKDDTTSDSCSDESFSQKSKNGVGSGVKSEIKREDTKKECEEPLLTDRKQKVEVIVNQESDVTITGVYATHHHEGFCTVSGMQYRISSTSHTQTTATANCEKDVCSRDDSARYTPLSALSSMQPPEQAQSKSTPVPELGGLSRRPGCSSAFSAPSPSAQHEPGYYQPAGPLIKETSADAERALARYHPPPHYHAQHPPVIQQYGPPYYPADLCYGRFYRPPGAYHMPPPQSDGQMVGVGADPYPPPQYYGTPPCYQHSPQRIPYVEYRGCPCPMNACPKNVLTGPATGKAPTGGGPDVPIRGACRPKAKDSYIDAHGSGKDPPLELEPPAAADAPQTGPLPAIGGASPKREFEIPASPARAEPAPIDLTTDDRPILDVKKENEGPIYAQLRKTDAQALREHNTSNDPAKASKRRYSRPKLEIDMKDTQLEDPCKTNGIGEHVKLQKRRKVSSEQTEVPRPETVTKEIKRKPQNGKRTPKIPTEKKTVKRKLEITQISPKAKKMLFEPAVDLAVDERITSVTALKETVVAKPKTKSALVLDNLIRKNSIDAKGYGSDTELNPADLFLSSKDNAAQNSSKKSLNNNNNILDNNVSANGVRSKTIAAVSQLIGSKSAAKNSCKLDKIESNISHQKTVLQTPTETKEDHKVLPKRELKVLNTGSSNDIAVDSTLKLIKVSKSPKLKSFNKKTEITSEHQSSEKLVYESQFILNKDTAKLKCDNVNDEKFIKVKSEMVSPKKFKSNGDFNGVKDLPLIESAKHVGLSADSVFKVDQTIEKEKQDLVEKKTKLAGSKSIEKVAKLLETMKPNSDTTETTKSIEGEKRHDVYPSIVENSAETHLKTLDRILSKCVDKATKLMPRRSEDKASYEKKEDTKEVIASKRCKPIKSVEKVAKLLVSKRPVIKTDEATLVVEDACASPMISMGRRRRRSGGRRGRRAVLPLALPELDPKNPPKWSNGWNWDGEPYISKVYLSNDSKLDRTARCWSHMRHSSGDRVSRGDCVLLRATTARQQPFVARVASLWENPDDGEMMMSLVWYYRPEHTERGRQSDDAPDEVFASRHRDANSVACIEDKCYVLTYNEYCRYRKRLKAVEEGIRVAPSMVPQLPPSEVTPAVAPNDSKLPPSVSPELVLFCRKIYDFRSKKLQVPNK